VWRGANATPICEDFLWLFGGGRETTRPRPRAGMLQHSAGLPREDWRGASTLRPAKGCIDTFRSPIDWPSVLVPYVTSGGAAEACPLPSLGARCSFHGR
jgi:hypothetical protein